MSVLKVGVLGGGFMAQMAHLPCLARLPEVELAGLCEARPELGRRLAAKWNIPFVTADYEQLLAQPLDAIWVLTPGQCHLNHVERALQRGRHVFVEKPLALGADSARKLQAAAQTAGREVRIGYMKRHETNLVELRRRLAENQFGRLLFARAHAFIGSHWDACAKQYDEFIATDEKPPFVASELDPGPAWLKAPRDAAFYSFGNPYYGLLDTGCHSVNLLRALIGRELNVVRARSAGGVRLVEFAAGETPVTLEFCVNFQMHRWDEVTELYFEKAAVRVLTPPPLARQRAAEVELYTEAGDLHQTLQLGNNHQWSFRNQTATAVADLLAGRTGQDLADAISDLEVVESVYRAETVKEN